MINEIDVSLMSIKARAVLQLCEDRRIRIVQRGHCLHLRGAGVDLLAANLECVSDPDLKPFR